MKKVSLLVLVSVVLLLAFSSCGLFSGTEKECEHQWTDATCTSPKTCTICGEREGSLLPHNLVDATCTDAKTCTLCNQTWGESLGHKWTPATCTEARTCMVCNVVEGDPPGHELADATCEKPITCKVCGYKEGEALGHKYVESVTAPTCTEDGYTTHTCSTCNNSYVDSYVSALGHLNDIILEAVEATCTEDGLTAGVKCSRCDTDTTKQIVKIAKGHDTSSPVIVKPTCTEKGYTEYNCSICKQVFIGNEVPALGHDFGDALCGTNAVCSREDCTDAGATMLIEHEWGEATCTEPSTCKRGCGATVGEPLGHNMSEASCLAPSTCLNKCGKTEGEKYPHVLSFEAVDGVPTYSCESCSSTFKLDNFYYLSGENYDNMTPGKANASRGFICVEGTDNPIIKERNGTDKYYELLKEKTTISTAQLELWIPKEDQSANQFTSGKGSVGFISFKLNAYLDTNFAMKIMDASSGERWSEEWHIKDEFFFLTPPALDKESGKMLVNLGGFNAKVLKTIEVTEEDPFTGWMDVIIGIELDANTDTITMHYYVDGEYLGSLSRALTTASNGVNCFYISGNTKAGGSGIMIDDIVFGYTVAGYWCFDGHVHEWTLSKTVKPDCIHNGYSIYTCKNGCVRRDEFVSPLGHVTEDVPELLPTCTEAGYTAGKLCTVCGVITEGKYDIPANGHDYTSEITVATCTDAGFTTHTCSVCGFVDIDNEVAALGHDFGAAKCTEVAVCLRPDCGFNSGEEPIGHAFAPATCTTPATCTRKDCGVTEGDPIPHDMLASTCVSPSVCSYGCGYSEGEIGTHVLTHSYADSVLELVCSACEVAFELEDFVYMDGKNHAGMTGETNSANYTVHPDTQNPAIVDGHYELLNKTGKRGRIQLWLPASDSDELEGFSCENDALGVISFKFNAYTNQKGGIALRLLDNTHLNDSDFKWPDYSFVALTIGQASTVDGVTTTSLTDFNGNVIATFESTDKFTGWVDFALGIELDSATEQITLHYYINGKIVSTYSEEMTIKTDRINSAYFSGYSSELGSGIMLDDVMFGYTAKGEWKYDDCEHKNESKVVEPTCTEGGYSILTCSECGRISISDKVEPLGHIGGTATCTEPANCERCTKPYGELLDHVLGTPATCDKQAVCKVCENPYGDLLPHTPATPICQGDTTCSECGAALKKQTHSLAATHRINELSYSCVYCEKTFTTEKNYYFDGSDKNLTNLTTVDEGGAFNGDKSTIVINSNGQYEFIHDDSDINGKAVVWIPKNSGGESMFDGFNTKNNAVGVVSFKVNAYMTEGLNLQFVDTSLRDVLPSNQYWPNASISQAFFSISAPSNNVVTVRGWDCELMKINVSDDNKWTGWIDVVIGIELSSEDDTVTVHYNINGEYITSAINDMTIVSDMIDGLYFNGKCSVAGGGYMLDDIGFGYSTKEDWIFDKK